MRLAILALACVVVLAAGGFAESAPTAVTTRSCAQVGAFFSVQIAGKIDGTYWGGIHRDLFAPVPDTKAMVAVWSFGSQSTPPVLYGWAADGRSRLRENCVPRAARAPSRGALRTRFPVEDGWAYGRRYECRQRGRVVLRTADLGGGVTRLTVWMEKSRELVAVAEARRGSAWVRASKRCVERPL